MKPGTLDQYIRKAHTDQTAKTYLYYISVFLMKHPNAKRYSYSDMLNYIVETKASTNDSGATSLFLSAIKRYYDYLIVSGQRNDHPCKSITVNRKKQPVQLQDLFSPSELEALMNRENRYANLELRNKVIISLLIYQGLVCSELCRLRLKDVDLDRGTIHIKGSNKTDGRTLELKPSQILLMQRYIETSRQNLLKSDTECLIVTHRGVGETTDGVHSMIEPLKALYPDRNLTPTTIRQSVISNWLNINKFPLEDVQQLAGHKWPSTTEQYRRKDMSDQLEKINMWHPLK